MNTPQFIIDELNAGMDGFTHTTVALPNVGDAVMVKLRTGTGTGAFYAIYSDENEFDVHCLNGATKNYRKEWYKLSKASVKSWMRIKKYVELAKE